MALPKNIGVLFDYNGVIVNDESLQKDAFRSVLNGKGVKLTDQLYSEIFLGRTDIEGFEEVRGRFPQELFEVTTYELCNLKTRKYIKSLVGNKVIYDGAIECIKSLSEQFSLGIVTSSAKKEFEAVMVKFTLRKYFSIILTAEDFKRGKPDPEPYAKGTRELGTELKKTIAIEDSPSGVRSAKSAGIWCIAVLNTSASDQLTEADLIVNTISEISVKTISSLLR
ncbi:MAG TPA: HAD family phosphatase [candidate division Zixibacteria bacterium]|nr:HAD family phosphatase [candidate division Zixibacteria bacterium]